MLEIQNVSKTFNAGTVNQKTALNGLNLKLNEGDFVTVIGGNGAGKSTMLNAVAGVWPVDEGKIIIDGVDVTRLSEHQRAAYIGRVFQDPMTGTAATMQIEENLALAARRGKPRTLRIGITKAEREQYRELLKTLDLGLEDRLTARVGLLSGGQRQALTLLMATLVTPKLLLLDDTLLSERKVLFKSIKYIPADYRVKISNDVVYAPIHNWGDTVHPAVTDKMRKWAWRQFYKSAGIRKNASKKTRASRLKEAAANPQAQMWKGLALTRKKKLSIRIPQRQFIGESEELNEKIEKKITEKIFNILTS